MLLGLHLKELGFEDIRFEFQFNPDRSWRADLAVPGDRLLLECCGGAFHGGHRRGAAMEIEYERLNWAQLNGWRILQFTNVAILRGTAKKFLQDYLVGVR